MVLDVPLIPFNRASLAGQELQYVADAVKQGHISGNGPFTRTVEQRISQIAESPAALMTTSCTHALELAARILELGPGDEVVVPAYTFVSTAAAFALTGARPVFVDVDAMSLNLDVELVRAAISSRTKAVCAVNYAGFGYGLLELAELCSRENIALVEDNAHGFGAEYMGQKLGTFGIMSTLSFHETKNITCGEGGALTLNQPELLHRAEILREKGTDRARFLRGQVDKYTWVDLGSSWVASDLLAAYLLGQLDDFEGIQQDRMAIWSAYDSALRSWASSLGIRMPFVSPQVSHSAHMYFLRMTSLAQRTRFIDHMGQRGIMTVFHYQALNTSTMGKKYGGWLGQCPVAEEAADTLVRLPLYRDLSLSEVDRVIQATLEFRG